MPMFSFWFCSVSIGLFRASMARSKLVYATAALVPPTAASPTQITERGTPKAEPTWETTSILVKAPTVGISPILVLLVLKISWTTVFFSPCDLFHLPHKVYTVLPQDNLLRWLSQLGFFFQSKSNFSFGPFFLLSLPYGLASCIHISFTYL